MRLFDAVAGNVMTSNVINKNDATKRQLNSELVGVQYDVKSLIAVDEPELVMPLFYSERSEFREHEMINFLSCSSFFRVRLVALSQLVLGLGRVLFRKSFVLPFTQQFNPSTS